MLQLTKNSADNMLPARNTDPPDKKDLPTFVDILKSNSINQNHPTVIPMKQGTLHKGEPAIQFTQTEIAALSSPLRLALVGKFITPRPSMDFLRRGFQTIGFKGETRIGLLNHRHILIRFSNAEDFQRCWLHGTWNFRQYTMKVLKWTPEFRFDEEPTFAPVWINLDHLPLQFFQESALLSIGNLIGRSLKIDEATKNLTRPSVARICVEINLLKPLTKRIWIGIEKEGFWQPIRYEDVPPYCTSCKRIGHSNEKCGQKQWRIKNHSEAVLDAAPQTTDPSDISAQGKQNAVIDLASKDLQIQQVDETTKNGLISKDEDSILIQESDGTTINQVGGNGSTLMDKKSQEKYAKKEASPPEVATQKNRPSDLSAQDIQAQDIQDVVTDLCSKEIEIQPADEPTNDRLISKDDDIVLLHEMEGKTINHTGKTDNNFMAKNHADMDEDKKTPPPVPLQSHAQSPILTSQLTQPTRLFASADSVLLYQSNEIRDVFSTQTQPTIDTKVHSDSELDISPVAHDELRNFKETLDSMWNPKNSDSNDDDTPPKKPK